jgi:type IV pilus assembly protein PilY1
MYGMDTTPTLWMCDVLNDGEIIPSGRDIDQNKTCGDGGDFVRIITSTRRGGGSTGFIYALDLSVQADNIKKIDPMFMWRIAGGDSTGDFSRLGQTWSQPRITTIMVLDENSIIKPKDVLIFGGGYDIKLDDNSKFSTSDNDGNDYLGNAIYIVDPSNGKKILSISGSGSGADIQANDMHFSIPSRVEFLDSDNDGLTDRLYVGDLGGQVWRVDLSKAVPLTGTRSAGPDKGTVVGLLAQISNNAAENRRRFFEPPSVVQVSDASFSTSEEYDYVLMGTGNRPNPLEETVRDKFYAFRDRFIDSNDLEDTDGDHVSGQNDGYPMDTDTPYSHTDSSSLLNITTKGVEAQAQTDGNLVKGSDGWFFDYAEANSGRPGEKTLSSPLTAAGAVIFTTFDPKVEAAAGTTGGQTAQQANQNDPCSASPSIGTARAYHLTILEAEPPETTELGGGTGANRFRKPIGSGIPSDVIPVFTEQGVVGIAQTDGKGVSLGKLTDNTPERAYWNESTDF